MGSINFIATPPSKLYLKSVLMERRTTNLSHGQHHFISSRREKMKGLLGSVDEPLRRRVKTEVKTIKSGFGLPLYSLTSPSIRTPFCESKYFSDPHEQGAYNMRDSYECEFHRKISNIILLYGIQV